MNHHQYIKSIFPLFVTILLNMGSRNYMFTLFPNDQSQYSSDEDLFVPNDTVRFCVWQLEQCPDTGRKHIQGYMELRKVVRLAAAKDLFKHPYDRTAHLERRRGSRQQAVDYCQKETTRIEGPWRSGAPVNPGQRTDLQAVMELVKTGHSFEDIVDVFPDQAARYQAFVLQAIESYRTSLLVPPAITLYPWQISLQEVLLGPPSPRSLMWYWDELGKTGKTTFSLYLLRTFPKRVQVFLGGKSVDVAFALDSARSIFIFDFSRDAAEYINYGLLEQIKNGYVWSPKYTSVVKQFNTPHVLVFSNQEPDRTKMSRDRWDVHHIASL